MQIPKLADDVTLNFVAGHHQYIFINAKSSRVPVTLPANPSPGFLFSGFINEPDISSPGTNNKGHMSNTYGSSNFQQLFLIDKNDMDGEECWCTPVVDSGVVMMWNSPDGQFQSLLIKLLVEVS